MCIEFFHWARYKSGSIMSFNFHRCPLSWIMIYRFSQMETRRLRWNKELVQGDPSLSAWPGLEHDSRVMWPIWGSGHCPWHHYHSVPASMSKVPHEPEPCRDLTARLAVVRFTSPPSLFFILPLFLVLPNWVWESPFI